MPNADAATEHTLSVLAKCESDSLEQLKLTLDVLQVNVRPGRQILQVESKQNQLLNKLNELVQKCSREEINPGRLHPSCTNTVNKH